VGFKSSERLEAGHGRIASAPVGATTGAMEATPADSWMDALSYPELLAIVENDPFLARQDLGGQSIDQVGNQALARAIDGAVMYAVWPEYWANLKAEFRLLICTNDKKYASVRRQMAAAVKKSQTTLVSTVAAALAVHLGVAAGLIAPFCALCLIALLRTGREAFCRGAEMKATAK
jgi:hypothetical protein